MFSKNKFPEDKSGYYERIPIRVGQYCLTENIKDKVVFETTDKKICNGGVKKKIIIYNSDDGWKSEVKEGAYSYDITPSVDLSDERLARRRAMWHTCQHMLGRDLSHKERFSITWYAHNDEAKLFKDDAFFKNGDPVTNDPFGKVLKN